MKEACEAALREAARIVNVVRERRVGAPSADSVVAWANASASRSAQPPIPTLGLSLLRQLRLVKDMADGTIQFAEPILAGGSEPSAEIEAFPSDVQTVVLYGALAVPELLQEFRRVFRYCSTSAQGGYVDWRLVPRTVRECPAWLWLQRMGIAEQSEHGLLLGSVVAEFIAESHVPAVPLSQADLDHRLKLQRERADACEIFVMGLERQRLRSCGVDYLADGISRVSVDDVAAGYDIRSFESDGTPRFIEVKSSAGPRERFFISDNERQMAMKHRAGYWLAWIGWSVRLPCGRCEIAWFRDPEALMQLADGPWRVSSSGTLVESFQDDTSIQSTP